MPARRLFALLIFVFVAFSAAHAASPDHWVATWATAPLAAPNAPLPPRPAPPASVPNSAQSNAPAPPPPAFEPFAGKDTTLRQIVHVSIGGSTIRVVLTNEFGSEPLTVSAASVALSTGKDTIDSTSLKPLTFSGKPSIVIPPGAPAVSDPVELKVAPLSDLAISLFFPMQAVTQLSFHPVAVQTNYSIDGNHVNDAALGDAAQTSFAWRFLKGVDVMASAKSALIVAFGDSITEGVFSSRDKNARWPDELAVRLHAEKHLQNLAVINEGIGGNRILQNGAGPDALARLSRDVIDQAGVKYMILLEAINDIGVSWNKAPLRPGQLPRVPVTADDLIQGYRQIIARAHAHGIKVFGATLIPYMGAGYSSDDGEKVRVAVNQWIRTGGEFDGVIDFEAAVKDPAHPDMMLPAYDHGDHLHPGDIGYKAMGDAINLALFGK